VLFLTFYIGADRFIVEANRVIEVIPLVQWKQVMGAPSGVVGLLNYHRDAIPVIDLSLLVMGRQSPALMNTRLVVIEADVERTDADGNPTMDHIRLALVTERVDGTVRLQESDFVAPDQSVSTAPYLGPIHNDGKGIIQLLNADMILSSGEHDNIIDKCQSAA
jgi:chemotaxis-related protein WspB